LASMMSMVHAIVVDRVAVNRTGVPGGPDSGATTGSQIFGRPVCSAPIRSPEILA
jgi:hypothetical protein